MVTNNEIAEFYDNYSSRQKSVAHNERHLYLYKEFKKMGIAKSANILEIGCGIGVMSQLILKIIPKGSLLGVDISPKSIEMAKTHCRKSKNATFFAGDIAEMEIPQKKYDFILMCDVVEHIPKERRNIVFSKLHSLSSTDTQIIINVPNPPIHEFVINSTTDNLQIIEEPVYEHELSAILHNNGFNIAELSTYSVWLKDEFQLYKVRRKDSYKHITL